MMVLFVIATKKSEFYIKKIVLILLILSLFTACENEPLDPDLTEQGEGAADDDVDEDDSESGDLTLSVYELDTQLNANVFGIPIEAITNATFNISNNKIISGTNALSANGAPFETKNQTITRNASGQITSNVSVNTEGVTTNETHVAYTNAMISQISYDFYIDEDDEDYIYNITYSGNTITRTEEGSSISTVFTLDGLDRIIKKESYDGTFSIQTETVTYTGEGNIGSSTTIGEVERDITYLFDGNTNPLKVVFEDSSILNFLSDDYSDEIGRQIAQFFSTNNWNGATFNGQSFSFDLEYNTVGRIIRRDIAYNFGAELAFDIDERFNYVN
jgi:hypothetical protein